MNERPAFEIAAGRQLNEAIFSVEQAEGMEAHPSHRRKEVREQHLCLLFPRRFVSGSLSLNMYGRESKWVSS